MASLGPLIAVGFASIMFNHLLQQDAMLKMRNTKAAIAVAQGQQLDLLAKATNAYAVKNFTVLTGGGGTILKQDGTLCTTTSVCPASSLSPTVSELINLGYLRNNFGSSNYYGGGYQSTLTTTPTGCSYPNCKLDGLVNLSTAITDLSTGLPDTFILGAAIEAIGSNGGYSKSSTPGTINGLNAGWSRTNPKGSVAGILAEQLITVGYDDIYYRLDGAVGLTGPLNAGSQYLKNIKPVAVGSACPAAYSLAMSDGTAGDVAGSVVTCQSSKWQLQTGSWKSPVTNYASLPASGNTDGDVRVTLDNDRGFVWNAGTSTWKALAIDQNGNFSVSGVLTVGQAASGGLNLARVATVGAACNVATDGNMALDSTGSPLYCQSGAWAKQITSSSSVITLNLADAAGKRTFFVGIMGNSYQTYGMVQLTAPLAKAYGSRAFRVTKSSGSYYLERADCYSFDTDSCFFSPAFGNACYGLDGNGVAGYIPLNTAGECSNYGSTEHFSVRATGIEMFNSQTGYRILYPWM